MTGSTEGCNRQVGLVLKHVSAELENEKADCKGCIASYQHLPGMKEASVFLTEGPPFVLQIRYHTSCITVV